MGAGRGVLIAFVAVFLFLSFLLLTLSLTLSSSLNYNNVQKETPLIAKDLSSINGVDITAAINQNYPLIQMYCNTNHTNYAFTYQGFNINLPCSVVSQGQDAVVNEIVNQAVHDIYYTSYNCNFISCFNQYPAPLFLFSEMAYNFWTSNISILIIVSIVLFVLAFFLAEKKTNTFILSGILLMISAGFVMGLNYAFSMFSSDLVFKVLGIFFSQAYSAALKPLIAGVVLLAAGIVLNIFKVGIFLSKSLLGLGKEKEEEKKEEKKPIAVSSKKQNKKSK